MKKGLIAFSLFAGMTACLAAANQLAGMLLFLLHRQNPKGASWQTMLQAWQLAPDDFTRKKIVLCAVFGALVGFGGPIALVVAALRGPDRGLFGRARFANRADIRKEKLDAERGILLGKASDKFLRLGGYEFVMLAAPTRTGKGVGFVVPNLLTYEGSVFVLDIKGENYEITSEFRRRFMGNEIYYFNPFSEYTARWNPLSYVPEDRRFWVTSLNALATIIYPTNEKDPFWTDQAKSLFIGLALLVLETPALPKTIGEILRQGSSKGQQPADYFRHIIEVRAATTPLSETCLEYLNRFLNNSETVLKGIVSSFTAPLAIWTNPILDKATSMSDFDLRDVRKRRMSIYVHVDAGEIQQAGFLLNLMFSQLVNENVKELPEKNPELKYQCLLMLDEFTAMGKVSILAKGVGYMAGYNMRMVLVIQDKEQLESVYGKSDSHNMVTNMGAVVYFTPTQIDEAEKYSKMIGYETVTNTSKQRSTGGVFAGGRANASETESAHSRALMLPQELLSMPKTKQLVVRPGIPVIHADKMSYFQDPYFVERYTAVPTRVAIVDGSPRTVPIPVPLPAANWRIYNTQLAASNYYLGEDFSDLQKDGTEDHADQVLVGLVNEPDSYPSEMVDAACKSLAKRKANEYLYQLERDNRDTVSAGPYRELMH